MGRVLGPRWVATLRLSYFPSYIDKIQSLCEAIGRKFPGSPWASQGRCVSLQEKEGHRSCGGEGRQSLLISQEQTFLRRQALAEIQFRPAAQKMKSLAAVKA